MAKGFILLLGKIVKDFTCSIKDPALESKKIFMVKLLNMDLSEKNSYQIAIENRLGLGIGDIVLIVTGSGARKLIGNKDLPIDCAITAKVESFNIDEKYRDLV